MRRIDFFMAARASTPATQGHHHDDDGSKTRRIFRIFVRTDATHRSNTAIPIRPNCLVPEHYKRAANNLLIGEGGGYIGCPCRTAVSESTQFILAQYAPESRKDCD